MKMQRRAELGGNNPVFNWLSSDVRPAPLTRLLRFCLKRATVKRLRNERGETLIMSAVCLTILLGFVGLATDVGLLWRAKRMMQTAADAGAVNGAAELSVGDWSAGAKAGTALNGVSDGVNGATVTVNNPPLAGAYAGDSTYVEVIASEKVQTVFMGVFGFHSGTITARAVAQNVPGKDCVITLGNNPSPPGASGTGIAASGSGTLSVPGCGVIDNAQGTSSIKASGCNASSPPVITAGSITVAGSALNLGNCTVSATNPTTVTTGITPVADPLAALVTAPTKPATCTNDPKIGSSTTIGPSGGGTICYNSLTINGGTITLNPGVYYINGNLNISGSSTLNGTGVTFYVTCNGTCASNNGYINIQGGNVALNLSAPTSGVDKGLLFYQNPSDPETGTFGGGATGNLNGIIYLPGAGLTMTGSSGTTFNIDLVTNWINLTGATAISPYAPLDVPSPIADPVLAE